jgi:hypothetical protein
MSVEDTTQTATATPPAPEAATPPAEPEAAPVVAETPDAPAEPERSSAETRNSSQMFEFSRYIHVGPGAVECEDGEDGSCMNPAHFHAWIRLPNQFQVVSLKEKADAAAARKLRVLRDEDSDSRAILDGELSELERQNDHAGLVEAVVNADFLKDHMAAMNAVRADEERGFTTIEDDRERLRALEQVPAEDRNEEEFEELQKHVGAYVDAVNAEREEIQRPLKEALGSKSLDELLDLVRENRIQGIAKEASEEAYAVWQWYICTLKPKDPTKPGFPSERVYGSIDHLKAAAPEVILALREGFQDIEAAAGRSLQAAAG